MSPLLSQLLFLGAVVYFLPYRIIVRPLLQNRRFGRPLPRVRIRVFRVLFVALMCGGGGWLAQILVSADRHGPTVMTIPHVVFAFAVMLAGGVAGLIAVHIDRDIDEDAYTANQMRSVKDHTDGIDHTMDAV